MPGFDGTGPMGQGPMTGGARGYCADLGGGQYARPRAFGFFGRGGGRGRRNMYYATGLTGWQRAGYPGYSAGYASAGLSLQEERDLLKSEAEKLKKDLENIQSRIADLENK